MSESANNSQDVVVEILETTDVNDIGFYFIEVTAYFSDKPNNFIVSDIFELEILDVCGRPDVTLPAARTIEYNITDSAITLNLASDFTVSPSECETTIEFRDDASVPISPSPFSFDTSTKVFTLAEIADSLAILDGETEQKTYTVTIAVIYPISETTVNFTIIVRNPCIDPNYVNLNSKTQQSTFSDNYSGQQQYFTFDPYTIDLDICENWPLSVTCSTIVGASTGQLVCSDYPLDS